MLSPSCPELLLLFSKTETRKDCKIGGEREGGARVTRVKPLSSRDIFNRFIDRSYR